jgi:hypothetical protein
VDIRKLKSLPYTDSAIKTPTEEHITSQTQTKISGAALIYTTRVLDAVATKTAAAQGT